MHIRNRKSSGFTLIELVIAMVIAAILAAIAIPAYSNYVRKSRRTEAKTQILDLASLEERFFSTNNTYSQLPTDLGYPAGTTTWTGVSTISGYYAIMVTAVAPTTLNPGTYLITATAQNAQLKDTNCQTFTVNQQGVQSATPDTTPPSCWQR